jgi:hypothetical protein
VVASSRSERALCRDVQVNLAYRWFCDLSIEDKVPDHSAFSRARNERFRNTDVFRTVFERVVEACIRAGLVGGEGFAVDASVIVADANKQRSIPGAEWSKELDSQEVSRAAKEYLGAQIRGDEKSGNAAQTPRFNPPWKFHANGPKTAGLTRLASPLSLGYAPLVLCPQVRLSDGTTGAGCDGTTAGGLAGSTTGRKTYSVFAIHSN